MRRAALISVAAVAMASSVAAATGGGAAPTASSIERGAQLAKLGDCAVCHTVQSGAPYAGGRAVLPTPFGKVFATNITPERDTWASARTHSLAEFERALHKGVRRDGAQLYPAFPYDHFTGASDGDIDALYAFLMTRRPVRAVTPANRLTPPLGFRPLMIGWKALYFRPEPFKPVAGKSDQWNRGAYLVATFGHCGACHTPRGLLGAEDQAKAFDGELCRGLVRPAAERLDTGRDALDGAGPLHLPAHRPRRWPCGLRRANGRGDP